MSKYNRFMRSKAKQLIDNIRSETSSEEQPCHENDQIHKPDVLPEVLTTNRSNQILPYHYSSYIQSRQYPKPFNYQFPTPTSKMEFYYYVDIMSKILFSKDIFIAFLKGLFQGGEVNHAKKIFTYADIIVPLESMYIEELKDNLSFGGWFNKKTLDYGFDIIGLCIYWYDKWTFDSVMTMLAEKTDTLNKKIIAKQNDKEPWYIQETKPVANITPRSFFIHGCQKRNTFYYLTSYGHPFQIVEYWVLNSGEILPVYQILMCHYNSQIISWHPFLPQKPYSLYNLNLIYNNPGATIVFVNDEKHAELLQGLNNPNEYVLTTCFGGHKNLLEANVSYLSGRDLYLYYDSESEAIHHIPEVIKRLKAHGVREIKISFDNWESVITSDEFMTDPGKWGCNIEPEEESKNQYRIVPSGKKVNGEDNESIKQLEPMSEAGDHIHMFGPSGSYKSYIGNSLAVALSIGNKKILKWSSGEPLRVLYIDGEMRPNSFKKRLERIMKGLDHFTEERPFDVYMVKDASGANINTDILSDEWQDQMKTHITKYDVIIIDNFYSLTDNSIASVKKALDWFKKLSQSGKTVIALDHSNRDGDIQGSILKERAADIVIKIDPDKDIKGLVRISFPKTRELPPEYTMPFDVEMLFQDETFRMKIVEGEEENAQLLSDGDFRVALTHELSKNRRVDRDQILDMLDIKQSTYYKYLGKEFPILTEKQKYQVKSEADRLLEALSS